MQVSNINNAQVSVLQSVKASEKNSENEKENAEKNGEKLYGKDEYIPSEKDEPIGFYAVSQDYEGNPSVDFDDPNNPSKESKKADGTQKSSEDKKNGKPEEADEKEKSESCTANTD